MIKHRPTSSKFMISKPEGPLKSLGGHGYSNGYSALASPSHKTRQTNHINTAYDKNNFIIPSASDQGFNYRRHTEATP